MRAAAPAAPLAASTMALVAALVVALCASPARADLPFTTRDQNPLLVGFGLPYGLPARLSTRGSGASLEASLNWSSTATLQVADQGTPREEMLLVDAEMRELRFALTQPFGTRFAARLELPWRYQGGGVLDGVVDTWHDVFSLPEGARPMLAGDSILLRYDRAGARLLDVRRAHGGVGDVTLAAGAQLVSTAHRALAAWLLVEAPTGNHRELLGNGRWDASLAVAGTHALDAHWRIDWQLNLSHLGKNAALRVAQDDLAWSGAAALSLVVTPKLELAVQADAHTGLVRHSGLDFLGDVVILTAGGSWRFDNGWRLGLGVGEDVKVRASPDVTFAFSLAAPLRGDRPPRGAR